jgi:hypothetical protein
MKKINCLFTLLLLTTSLQAEENIKPVRKNVLKTTFLSFITGSAKLTYERATLLRQSFEITGGVIGLGVDNPHRFTTTPISDMKGGLVRAAYKFMPFASQNNPLNGFYHKPEYAFSAFSYYVHDEMPTPGIRHFAIHTIMYDIGYQWVKNRFVFDSFVGMGRGWGTMNDCYHHGFITPNDNNKMTLTFGMRVGFAF